MFVMSYPAGSRIVAGNLRDRILDSSGTYGLGRLRYYGRVFRNKQAVFAVLYSRLYR